MDMALDSDIEQLYQTPPLTDAFDNYSASVTDHRMLNERHRHLAELSGTGQSAPLLRISSTPSATQSGRIVSATPNTVPQQPSIAQLPSLLQSAGKPQFSLSSCEYQYNCTIHHMELSQHRKRDSGVPQSLRFQPQAQKTIFGTVGSASMSTGILQSCTSCRGQRKSSTDRIVQPQHISTTNSQHTGANYYDTNLIDTTQFIAEFCSDNNWKYKTELRQHEMHDYTENVLWNQHVQFQEKLCFPTVETTI
jgi:hypothetical protein